MFGRGSVARSNPGVPRLSGASSASPTARLIAAGCLAGAGAVHLALAPGHFAISYLGVLFVSGGIASLAVAVRLRHGPAGRGLWGAGVALAGGMAAGLLLSRTVGLPGMLGFAAVREPGVWGPLETVSLLLEFGFVTVAWLELSSSAQSTTAVPAPAGNAGPGDAAAISRRRALAALVPVAGAATAGRLFGGESFGLTPTDAAAAGHHGDASTPARSSARHAGGRLGVVGSVDPRANAFDPHEIVRDFDGGTVRREGAHIVREWELVAEDKEIEVAPGVKYAAWTYNGRVPGPTLRAREGERLRVRFTNGSTHPHTIHFHGIHTDVHDGVPGVGPGDIAPGESFTYEFDAQPAGFHHYHCHSTPLADHIAKGLYGAFIVDPADGRPEADEVVMVQNGFDTNFDRSNEIYAVNTVAFAYMDRPIQVKRDQLVRIYLLNILEFDFVNSFHLHGNFFHRFPTGTSLEPVELTDTIVQGQGQRDILELRFPFTGKYMFHAHVSEFAELGWMGFFDVVD